MACFSVSAAEAVVASAENMAQDLTAVCINVDNFQEAYGFDVRMKNEIRTEIRIMRHRILDLIGGIH